MTFHFQKVIWLIQTPPPPENAVVQYDVIDAVIKLVKKFGRNCKLCDIEHAFRITCIHPSDYHLLGFTWNHYFYYDRCLPMGASSSCQIFEKFSCALQWIMVDIINIKQEACHTLLMTFYL